MSLLYIDSFDHYLTADITSKWTGILAGPGGGTVAINSTSGRHNSAGLKCSYGTGGTLQAQLSKTLPAVGTVFIIGQAFKTDLVPSAQGSVIMQVFDGATPQLTLMLQNDMRLQVKRGSDTGTTLGGPSPNPLSLNVFCYIEWKVFIDPTAGTVEVRVDTVPVINLINQNTRNSTASQWSRFLAGLFATSTPSTPSNKIEIDDVYAMDGTGPAPWNNFLGDVRVDTRAPTGVGANSGWTPSVGANWSCVDDVTPNANTDYVAAPAASIGVIDTYVLQDAVVPGGTIYGVQHCISATKVDSGSASIAATVRHGGLNFVDANIPLPSGGYTYALQIDAINPATGSPWLEADFNADEFGFKRTA